MSYYILYGEIRESERTVSEEIRVDLHAQTSTVCGQVVKWVDQTNKELITP